MNNNQKILKEIHCRYNFYISVSAHLSHLYVGYVDQNNYINSKVLDLFLTFLYKINFPNPEKTQEYIYNKIEQNLDNKVKLNNLFQKFKKTVKQCKYPDYREDKNWRNFMDDWDRQKERLSFDWEQWDKNRKKHPNLYQGFKLAIERNNT
ncbi:MAG: hypothetical protein ACO3UU_00095 [Minisyncoccia bacterium]